jgi:hypothetical protein
MKVISVDRAFLYYAYERADGKTEGIRIGRSAGAIGFSSDTPLSRLCHPVALTVYDGSGVSLPVERLSLPPVMLNVIGELAAEHPELENILTGKMGIEEAFR